MCSRPGLAGRAPHRPRPAARLRLALVLLTALAGIRPGGPVLAQEAARSSGPAPPPPAESVSPGLDPAVLAALESDFEAAEARWMWASERWARLAAERRSLQEPRDEDRLESRQFGPLTVLGRRTDLDLSGVRLEESWSRFRAAAGVDPAPFPSPSSRILVRSDDDSIQRGLAQAVTPLPVADIGPDIFADALRRQLPASAAGWVPARAIHLPADRERARAEMIRHLSPRMPECLSGEDAVCLAALGLTPSRLDASTAERAIPGFLDRVLAEQGQILLPDGFWDAMPFPGEGCGSGSNMEACLFRLRRSLPHAEVRLTSPAMIHAFLEAARTTGGPQAWDRALAAPADAPLREVIEALADAPLDEVLIEWRARLTPASPPARPEGGRGRALVWAGLFGLLALTSTRWRFG